MRAFSVSQPMVVQAAIASRPKQFPENFRIGRMRTVANEPLVVKSGSCTFTRVKFLCMLGFLTLCGVTALGQEPRHSATSAPEAELRGRVFERGTLTPLNGARIVTAGGETATDENGQFTLRIEPGEIPVSITLEGYEPLKVTEHAGAGEGVRVEYRLLPLPTYKKRYVST